MAFEADNPTSPLFMVLLLAVLVDVIFSWSGIVRAQLPNLRTSTRGARIAGIFSLISLVCLFVSYHYYSASLELIGTIALVVAGALFVAGILLAERIPD